jgi:hypothetical protein
MLPDQMIEPGTLEVSGDRVRISLRMPWYRALPFSSVAGITWAIDGHEVDAASLTWSCDGTTLPLADLAARHDLWWYVLDSAVVEGAMPDGVAADGEHDVALSLGLYIPYITTDLGVLRLEERDSKSMSLEAAA